MKIVYVVEDYYVGGGVERIISQKANILHSKYNHNVTIISVYKDEMKDSYLLDEGIDFIFLNVPMVEKNKNSLTKSIDRIKTLFTASKLLNNTLEKINPDIIFFTTTLGALLLPFCRTKAKKIYESHLSRNFNPYNCFFFLMEKKADAVVCLTEDDAKLYKYAKKVYVIPNFFETETNTLPDYSVKKAIAVGRLEHQKGFDILIDCWKTIHEKNPDWQLHIYGEGSLKESLQNQIDEYNLHDNVILCGRNENIIEKYSEYSLFLMTSRYEGLPMVLIESQSCGLPAVSFDFECGAKEIIKNKINGFLVEQGNKEEFCKTVFKMTDDEELRRKYGRAALKTKEIYKKDVIMEKWIKLISELSV